MLYIKRTVKTLPKSFVYIQMHPSGGKIKFHFSYNPNISNSNWEVPKQFKYDTEQILDVWIFQQMW